MAMTYNERNEMTASRKVASFLRSIFTRQESAIILLCIIVTLFFYSRNPAMLAPLTIISIIRTMAFPALIAMGMVQLMIAGEIDLSTGAMMSLGAVFAAKLIRDVGLPIPVAVVCSLGAAVLVGLANAVFTVKVGVPAVITTIGTGFIVRGISYSFTNGLPIYPLPKEVGIIGTWRPLGISFTFFLALGVMIVVQILLSRTRWGSSLFATGGNKIAAEVCGINTDHVKAICFVVTSLLAGCAQDALNRNQVNSDQNAILQGFQADQALRQSNRADLGAMGGVRQGIQQGLAQPDYWKQGNYAQITAPSQQAVNSQIASVNGWATPIQSAQIAQIGGAQNPSLDPTAAQNFGQASGQAVQNQWGSIGNAAGDATSAIIGGKNNTKPTLAQQGAADFTNGWNSSNYG